MMDAFECTALHESSGLDCSSQRARELFSQLDNGLAPRRAAPVMRAATPRRNNKAGATRE